VLKKDTVEITRAKFEGRWPMWLEEIAAPVVPRGLWGGEETEEEGGEGRGGG